jgi:hypothetical protein
LVTDIPYESIWYTNIYRYIPYVTCQCTILIRMHLKTADFVPRIKHSSETIFYPPN